MTTPTTTTAPIQTTQQGPAIEVTGPIRDHYEEILTPEAIAFLTELHHRFASRRHDRLAATTRPTSAKTGTGGSPAPALASRTAASRSPGRPTRR